jgi:hypothetical protein
VTDLITGEFADRLVLTNDTTVSGRIDGDLEISGGARVELHGQVSGNLRSSPCTASSRAR